ncbi:MAG TPA: M48 family metalloprotease [Terriglobales bacterium]|nr:M48 family metalloprotease [Terriglobales bacterium]
MRVRYSVVLLFFAVALAAQDRPVTLTSAGDQIILRITQRENELATNLRQFSPLVETYIQILEPDAELGYVPKDDRYFLGKLNLKDKVEEASYDEQQPKGKMKNALSSMSGLFSLFGTKLDRRGFLYTALVDDGGFTPENYEFEYVRREFLGEVRCLVFNVVPKKGAKGVHFLGRMWVEDQGYSVVRFNGVRTPSTMTSKYIHFDSWRVEVAPGMWLPALVYTEESNLKFGMGKGMRFKGQTRFWGYNVTRGLRAPDELTHISVDNATQAVKDESQASMDMSPLKAEHVWQSQAEDSVLEKIQRAGLLAPEGEVDKVLKTVINNLIITNNLDLPNDVRCRVLLTAPLESFTVGNTIIVSRGMLDVLPDEATLAAMLAHELAHIVLGHQVDTQYAFYDRTLFPDEDVFRRIAVSHTEAEEAAADKKSIELLKKSPYADKLQNVGLFLKTVAARSPNLPNLIHPHLGNRLAEQGQVVRMSELAASAPELQMNKSDQVTALPIGGRIKVDPWNDKVELMKGKPLAALSAREKQPFEITPIYPYLTRSKVEAPAQAGVPVSETPEMNVTGAVKTDGNQR